MFTVAMIGPDGVGKTTVARQLEGSLPMPSKYLYMGVNLEASNVALPTSRLLQRLRRVLGRADRQGGPLDHERADEQPKGLLRRVARRGKRAILLANQIADEWYRQMVIRSYLRRGFVVLLDRDFFVDYYAYDIAGSPQRRSWTRMIHGWVLTHFYRRPDLVICLDAAAETMYRRKGEGTVDLLNRRRGDYQQLRAAVKHFTLVDADRPLDEVVRDVREQIAQFPNLGRPLEAQVD